jgi:membrane protein
MTDVRAAPLLRQTLQDWVRHRCISKGAALAFYALLSFAPVLVLVIAIAGAVFGPEAAAGEVLRQLDGLVGREGAKAVEAMIKGAHNEDMGGLASLIAGIVLLVGSTTAFAELKDSLDEIWAEHSEPASGLVGALQGRLLSFGLVVVLGFLMLVSLAVNAGLAALERYWVNVAGESTLLVIFSSLVTFLAIGTLFAAIYKLLPAVRLSWSDVAIGALITTALFSVGKYLIGLYLGNAAVTSSFGAAGSLGVLALWVYYSAQIFFFGAEFTRLYALQHGSLRGRKKVTADTGKPYTARAAPLVHPKRRRRPRDGAGLAAGRTGWPPNRAH